MTALITTPPRSIVITVSRRRAQLAFPLSSDVDGGAAATTAECLRLAQRLECLAGRGTAALRGAVHRLVVAIELRAQEQRRLAAETLRADAAPQEEARSTVMLRSPSPPLAQLGRRMKDIQAALRDCKQIATSLETLTGPGAFAVHSAARQLVVELELFAQDQCRVRSETLRRQKPP